MAESPLRLNIEYFNNPDKSGALGLGLVYVGKPDLDPEIEANRVTVTIVQEDGTRVTIAPNQQPLTLNAGGNVDYLGSPVTVLVNGIYSVKVLDLAINQKFYVPFSNEFPELVAPLDNVAEMITAPGDFDGQQAYLGGYYDIGDGGGGPVYWDATSTETADNGMIFGAFAVGRWKRPDVVFGIKEFGAIAGTDSTASIKNAVAFVSTIPGSDVYVNPATSSYLCSEKLAIGVKGMGFISDSPGSGIIEFTNATDAGIELGTDDSLYTDYTGTAADFRLTNVRLKGPGKTTSTVGLMDWEGGGQLFNNVVISHFGTGYEVVSSDINEWIKVAIHNCTTAGFIAGPSDQFTMIAPYIFSNTTGLVFEYAKNIEITMPKFVFNTGSDIVVQTPDSPKYPGYSNNNTDLVIRSPWFESGSNKTNYIHLGKDANTISAQDIVIYDPFIITGHTITSFCEIDGATDVSIIRPNIAIQSTGTFSGLVENNTFGGSAKHIEIIHPRGKLSSALSIVSGTDTKVTIVYSKDGVLDVSGFEYGGIGYRIKPDVSGSVVDIQSLISATWVTMATLDAVNKEIRTPTGGYTLKTTSSLYSNYPFAIGGYYLWVDATGDLRIKSGKPTSDTDGAVVGTQT